MSEGSARRRAIAAALARALPHPPGELTLKSVSGGDINQAALLDAGGATYFVKWNDHPLPRQFEVEAAGLAAMAAAESGLTIPKPLGYSDVRGEAFLLLEYLAPARREPGFDESLGRGLSVLHRSTAPEFGFAMDGTCGATPQPNGWMGSWLEFYRERRLGHQLKLARARGLDPKGLAVLEQLVQNLERFIPDEGPPALIHGDLWSGNLHVDSRGRPSLIDPAAYYAHREAELGMMMLFGGFSSRVFAAYEEAWPLTKGWRERVDLYSLYHVLNHYHLFGGGYGAQAVRIAERYR